MVCTRALPAVRFLIDLLYTLAPLVCSDLTDRIENAEKSTNTSFAYVQELSVDLAKLAKSLVDSTSLLPAYDRRQYESVTLALLWISVLLTTKLYVLLLLITANKDSGAVAGAITAQISELWFEGKVCVQEKRKSEECCGYLSYSGLSHLRVIY